METKHLPAHPYAWPWDGHLTPAHTALVVITLRHGVFGAHASSQAVLEVL